MPVVRTAIIPFMFSAGQQLSIPLDNQWYRNYFFGLINGQAGYWMKQTDSEIVLDGEVLDFALVTDPNPDLTNRTNTINWAISAMENDRGVDFGTFDIIILVIIAPSNIKSDGGSTSAISGERTHAGIVIREGDRFDFVAHELGHALGLNHSFGDSNYKNSSWSMLGEYGHPYCVMSAMGYGGIGGPYFPVPPRDGRNEYLGLGPSVNAGTALARGWLDAYVYQLPGAPVEIELRSRHWLGKIDGFTPQAIEVRAPDGKTYVLEYREDENSLWDKGQGSPGLIVNAVKGSSADVAHPNTNSATFLKIIRIPISLISGDGVYHGPGFSIEIMNRYRSRYSLYIRLTTGSVKSKWLMLNSTKEIISEAFVESGVTTFEPGDYFCVEGTWHYDKVQRNEKITFEAIYALVEPPFDVVWSIDGKALTSNSGELIFTHKPVKITTPKLSEQNDTRSITIRYEIELLQKGSRLRIFNNPSDGTYKLQVNAEMTTEVGNGSVNEMAEFFGIEYRYSSSFYDNLTACLRASILSHLHRIKKEFKIVLDPVHWTQIPESLISPVEQMLDVLAFLHSQGEALAYRSLVNHLARRIGTPLVTPLILSLEEKADLKQQIIEREPQFHRHQFTNDFSD